MDIVTRITVKSVCQEKTRKMLGTLKEIMVMQIFGILIDVEQKESTLRPAGWKEGDEIPMNYKFIGTFQAQALAGPCEKKWYRSSVAYLPGVVSDMVAIEFKKAKIAGFPELQFAFIIGAQEDDTEIGYHYFGKSLTPVPKEDPLRKFHETVTEYQRGLTQQAADPAKPQEAAPPSPGQEAVWPEPSDEGVKQAFNQHMGGSASQST